MEPDEYEDEPKRPLRLYFTDPLPAQHAGWDAAVVVPTLNERGSIGRLLDEILSAHPDLHVVIVDDGSTDGTTEFVRSWAEGPDAPGMGRVHLLARGAKKGYASAVQDGMRLALENGARRVLQMDADGSHDPRFLPAMLKAAETHTLVLGSRYVPGGGTENWPLSRQILSRTGSLLARLILHLPAHDCTGGFRCWDAGLLVRSGILEATLDGFAFQFAALDRAKAAGATVAEVPIVFSDRTEGLSKMSGRIIGESARVLARLWWANVSGGVPITQVAAKPSPALPALPTALPQQGIIRRVA